LGEEDPLGLQALFGLLWSSFAARLWAKNVHNVTYGIFGQLSHRIKAPQRCVLRISGPLGSWPTSKDPCTQQDNVVKCGQLVQNKTTNYKWIYQYEHVGGLNFPENGESTLISPISKGWKIKPALKPPTKLHTLMVA